MNAYMNQYQNNHILTAPPEQVLIMLYDGAIRFVKQAKLALERKDVPARVAAIGKALAIVTEFANTLDFEIGGEIALDLKRLYDFMSAELMAVNAGGDAGRLDPVENILVELREAWVGAAKIYAEERQATSEHAGSSMAATL